MASLGTKETSPGVWTEASSTARTIFDIENKLVSEGKLAREDIPYVRRQFNEHSGQYKAGENYARFLQRITAIRGETK